MHVRCELENHNTDLNSNTGFVLCCFVIEQAAPDHRMNTWCAFTTKLLQGGHHLVTPLSRCMRQGESCRWNDMPAVEPEAHAGTNACRHITLLHRHTRTHAKPSLSIHMPSMYVQRVPLHTLA